MKKRTFKKYKIFSLVIIFTQLFYLAAFPYAAKAVQMPTATYSTMATDLDSYLNSIEFNNTDMTNDQVKQQSSSEKRLEGPEVQVLFNSSNVRTGSVITAEANTSGFTLGDKDLYFTWYLKHKSCDLGNDVTPNSYCDPDGDGEVTVNDWKVEAMRIVARGTFETKDSFYSGDKTSTEENDDGYQSYFGNEIYNGKDKDEASCYIQDNTSGRIYELAKIEPIFTCPEGTHQQCVTKAGILGEGTGGDQTVTGCQKTVACMDYDINLCPKDINNVPIAANIMVPDDIPDKQYCQATTNNTSTSADFGGTQYPHLEFKDSEDIDIFKLTPDCGGGGDDTIANSPPICVPDGSFAEVTGAGRIYSNSLSGQTLCESIGVGGIGGTGSNAGTTCTSPLTLISNSLEEALADGKNVDSLIKTAQDTGVDDNLRFVASGTFLKEDNLCKHLFPVPNVGRTGDGKFIMGEEEFWGTDPKNSKTAENQNLDEANVVGLGINEFTWEYRVGDEVGVAVEGTFTKETKHGDASKMVMWALSKNTCVEGFKEATEENKVGFYSESIQGDSENTVNILAADFDIDDCLEENLLDPSGSGKLSVDVTYNPGTNLINDPEGGELNQGSIINLDAAVSDFVTENGTAVSKDNFYYNWKIETSMSTMLPPLNSDPWKDITTEFKKVNPNLKMDGLGLNSLEVQLNIPQELFLNNDETQYIRFKAEASQEQNEGGALKGVGTVIIKIKQLNDDKRIMAFPVHADSSGMLSLLDNQDQLCSDSAGKYMCYIAENEIIGLKASQTKLSNYEWFLNGESFSCTQGMSSQCGVGNIVFFPAQQTEDGIIKIVLKAKDVESGSYITVERYFSIIVPSVAIDSADFSVLSPKLYGFYKGVNGEKTADYSDMVYEKIGTGIIKLKALYYPAWKADQSRTQWFVNGMAQQDWNDKNEIEIDSEGVNEINVELIATYGTGSIAEANNLRKALYDNWQISPEEIVENEGQASIRIEINNNADELAAKGSKNLFSAMLTSHISEELGFMVRLLLTAMLIVFVTGLIFTFMPETTLAEDFNGNRR